MLGAKKCCCTTACGSSTSSGGAGITENAYVMPEYSGQVQFYYNAISVPDRFTIYNTDNPSEVYFDTGVPVSGNNTIYFYKPEGVTSVTVRVEGPEGTGWNYTIGCPEVCTTSDGTKATGATCEISSGQDIEIYYPRVGASYGYIKYPNTINSIGGYYIHYTQLDDPIWSDESLWGEGAEYIYVGSIEFPVYIKFQASPYRGTFELTERDSDGKLVYVNENYPICNNSERDFPCSEMLSLNTASNSYGTQSCFGYFGVTSYADCGIGANNDFNCSDFIEDFDGNYRVKTRSVTWGSTQIGLTGIDSGAINLTGDIGVDRWSNRIRYGGTGGTWITCDDYVKAYDTSYDLGVQSLRSFYGVTRSLIHDAYKFYRQNGNRGMYIINNPDYPDKSLPAHYVPIQDFYMPTTTPWAPNEDRVSETLYIQYLLDNDLVQVSIDGQRTYNWADLFSLDTTGDRFLKLRNYHLF